MALIAELKRRNVFKVGVAYVIVAWLLIQVASIVLPTFEAPAWIMQVFTFFIILGFPLACFFAWAFELTPEGIKPSSEVTPGESIAQDTGRKLNVLITGLLIGAVIGAGAIWLLNQQGRIESPALQVQQDGPPANATTTPPSIDEQITQIRRYTDQGNWESAYALARDVESTAPDAQRLSELWPGFTRPFTISTNPTGARVYRRAYTEDEDWEDLGVSPLDNVRLPRGVSMLRFELEGYDSVIRTQFIHEYGGQILNETVTNLPSVLLDPRDSLPDGMVRVPGWSEAIAGETVQFRDFFISRYEVTNNEYKAFVNAGGYRRPEYWRHPVIQDGKELGFEEAMALFVDRTGRPGPATWEVGDYPEGHEDYPVGGVSWYEATAYSNYVNRELPTIYHWRRAYAVNDLNGPALVIPASNLDSDQPAPAGQYHGMTWTGAYDMAGNVREWTYNEQGEQRYILGGGWNDHSYIGVNLSFSQSPLDRSETNGIRLISTRDDETIKAVAHRPVNLELDRDYLAEEPISDEVFESYRNLFRYDRTPLNARIESTKSTRLWKRERITFDAAYGDEQMVLYLYLPLDDAPPYQTIMHWPGFTFFQESIDNYFLEDFLVKDGRAIAFPVYKGLYERGDRTPPPMDWTVAGRNMTIQWLNDLRRSIDYLETRADIDTGKFSFFGISWGAAHGPLVLSMEPRLKTAVLYVGGIFTNVLQREDWPLPEIDQASYLPRVNIPVLMINGEFDPAVPLEESAKPFYELLGTKEPDKKMVVAPGGHYVPRNVLIRESLDWLDKYLGPVN